MNTIQVYRSLDNDIHFDRACPLPTVQARENGLPTKLQNITHE